MTNEKKNYISVPAYSYQKSISEMDSLEVTPSRFSRVLFDKINKVLAQSPELQKAFVSVGNLLFYYVIRYLLYIP